MSALDHFGLVLSYLLGLNGAAPAEVIDGGDDAKFSAAATQAANLSVVLTVLFAATGLGGLVKKDDTATAGLLGTGLLVFFIAFACVYRFGFVFFREKPRERALVECFMLYFLPWMPLVVAALGFVRNINLALGLAFLMVFRGAWMLGKRLSERSGAKRWGWHVVMSLVATFACLIATALAVFNGKVPTAPSDTPAAAQGSPGKATS